MTNTDQVCPVMASSLSGHGRQHSLRQFSDTWEDSYEGNYRNARRAFLSSYHFSEENGIRDKLRRSVKEINEVVRGVVSDIREEICKRRIRIKAFRFSLGLPCLILSSEERVDAVINSEFLRINHQDLATPCDYIDD
ncbi:hypothetical protein NC653_019577 [Populus alba x Populus x berolinensis]|uniref:Uncharacterized protein n=1 Tax=Populus alba x Populus x berolinensis TaxID=444605 RepID=A0AAD6QJ94_9ROSI|nr:hypothetical protein NC653_019577 [Populus alba x Populus x berolinensis]